MDTQHEDGVSGDGEECQGEDGEGERFLEWVWRLGQVFRGEGLSGDLDEEAGEEVEGHEEDSPEDCGQVDRQVLYLSHG